VQPEGSGVVIPLAVPPEFQGPGGATNPEEMLTSAIASCYSITFGIIAANRKLPVLGIKTEAVGEVEQQGAAFTFKKITIRPQISVRSDATEAEIGQVMDFARRADAYCIVTNAIRDKVSVVLDPAVRVIEA
jgi:peroxiredoxin-like protein